MTERFTLLTELGRGGMGVVWKARDEETGQIVALKLLREVYAEDPEYLARFERELALAKRIHSAHVVEVLGYGARDGAPYLALEYVDGPSLRELLASHGPYEWPEAKDLLVQITQGLADAHAAGVVHRDLKPSNILIGPDGVAKLADFGIAKGLDLTRVTGTSTLLGTPAYLAPEGPLDERSDLYSLGIVAYELLSGTAPFMGSTYQEVIVRHIREAPDLGRLPPEARDMVGWLLEKDPKARPQRASDVLAALRGEGPAVPRVAMSVGLQEVSTSQPAVPRVPVAGAPDRRDGTRRRAAFRAAAVGIACLVVVGSAGVAWGISRHSSAPDPVATTLQSSPSTAQPTHGQSAPITILESPPIELSLSSPSSSASRSPAPTASRPTISLPTHGLSTPGPTSEAPPAATPTLQSGSGQTPTPGPLPAPKPTPSAPPTPTPTPTPSPTPESMFVTFSLASTNPLSVGSYATFNVQSLVGSTCQLSSHFVSGPGPDPGDATSEPFTLSLPALYQIQLAVAYPAGTYNFAAVCTASGGAPTVTSAPVSVTWQ